MATQARKNMKVSKMRNTSIDMMYRLSILQNFSKYCKFFVKFIEEKKMKIIRKIVPEG